MRRALLCLMFILLAATQAAADRVAYVELARKGWNYQLRTTMVGRDLTIPVHINGRDLAGASLCLVGERPHPNSLEVINAFRDLARHVFGKPLPMRYAGAGAANCGSGRTVVLRLYSGHPPNQALSDDLSWMNGIYQLGLPHQRYFAATSPAMAQTFFGRRGQGTHIMVKQPRAGDVGALERSFYTSILVEELFQSFTFGMDILLFDRAAAFQSKLQETPLNLQRLPWESRGFMRAMLRSNPVGLCAFDVFMMHAVAEAPVDQTTEPGFIDYVDAEYDTLAAQAAETMADARFAALIAPGCQRAPI
ncbi:hypothetical protein [Roseobacter sinensis]|uniref:Uncharacterized protein n=1 Tax=Roseobacter sinensis TaxID=2931391 RepID=A0ABT3BKF9_9RHOB|nr:hypothetical protein [Roseobacter sp. WL0113]MCV3274051.1 hypothetical protein [Roseobacter sp. WL0113]